MQQNHGGALALLVYGEANTIAVDKMGFRKHPLI